MNKIKDVYFLRNRATGESLEVDEKIAYPCCMDEDKYEIWEVINFIQTTQIYYQEKKSSEEMIIEAGEALVLECGGRCSGNDCGFGFHRVELNFGDPIWINKKSKKLLCYYCRGYLCDEKCSCKNWEGMIVDGQDELGWEHRTKTTIPLGACNKKKNIKFKINKQNN